MVFLQALQMEIQGFFWMLRIAADVGVTLLNPQYSISHRLLGDSETRHEKAQNYKQEMKGRQRKNLLKKHPDIRKEMRGKKKKGKNWSS